MPNNKSQKEVRRQVWAKSSNLCAHCGKKVSAENDRTIDHVIPQAVGGTNDNRNLMPLCLSCNRNRASGEIVPDTYYKYASRLAIEDLWSYIREWKAAHTTAAGSMTVERYGIIER